MELLLNRSIYKKTPINLLFTSFTYKPFYFSLVNHMSVQDLCSLMYHHPQNFHKSNEMFIIYVTLFLPISTTWLGPKITSTSSSSKSFLILKCFGFSLVLQNRISHRINFGRYGYSYQFFFCSFPQKGSIQDETIPLNFTLFSKSLVPKLPSIVRESQ